MTCRACHEECNDSCSGPVSRKIYVEIVYNNVYNRDPLIVLDNVRTLHFQLLTIPSLVLHNVQ